ncbi:MAG: hypothetical protein H6780_03575 [Candidatus Nomurabacteria bacterium]|nr:MAG: hypothetical protein H6780_03575 [Candidatus Nomurabacteria bacterium]
MSERLPNSSLSDVPNYSNLGGDIVLSAESVQQTEAEKITALSEAVHAASDKITALKEQRFKTIENGKKTELTDQIDTLQDYIDKLCAEKSDLTADDTAAIENELRQHLDFEAAKEYDEMSPEDFDDLLTAEEIEQETLRHYEAFLAKQRNEDENLPVLTDIDEEATRSYQERHSVDDGIPVLTDVIKDGEDDIQVSPKRVETGNSIDNSEDVAALFGEAGRQETVAKITVEEQISVAKYLIKQIDKGVQDNIISTAAADAAVAELENRIYGLERQLSGETSNKNAVLKKTDEVLRQLARRNGTYTVPEVTTENQETPMHEMTPEAEAEQEQEVREFEQEAIPLSEYTTAKKEFKAAKRVYLEALEKQYRKRNVLSKMGETFGVGQKRAFTPEEQVAYDTYMAASKKFYEYTKATGVYDKLQVRMIARLERQHEKGLSLEHETPLAVAPLVADRFVFNPAQARLDVQSGFLPESVQDVKKRLLRWVKQHPYVSVAAGGALTTYGLTVNAPGVLAAAASGMMGRRFIVDRKAAALDDTGEQVVDDLQSEALPDLEQLEARYFTDARRLAISRNRNRAVASALGLSAAAAAESLLGDPDFTQASEVVNEPGDDRGQELRMPESIADKLARADRVAPMSPEHIAQFERMENSGILSADSWSRAAAPQTDTVGSPAGIENPNWVKPGIDAELGVVSDGGTNALPGVVQPGIDYAASGAVPAPASSSIESVPVPPAPATPAPAPVVETGPNHPAPVAELQPQSVESGPVQAVTDEARVSGRAEILAERTHLDSVAALERIHGYQPRVAAGLDALVTTPIAGQDITHHMYAEMVKAYEAGMFNLPATRAEYVSHNPTAFFSFIEEHAKELTNNKFSAFLGGSDSLGLSPDEWKALGFSSGDPQVISPADKIQTGKLIKLILENAAEEINGKLKPS